MLQQRALQQHGVLQQHVLLLLLLLRALQQHVEAVATGSHPTESLVAPDCVSSGHWLCVSHGPKAAVPRNPDGKKQGKTNN